MADTPYKEVDYIILDTGERGYVTSIGIRSTRIQTRDDIEITIPNSVIATSEIINESGGTHEKERIRITVDVAYGSDLDKLSSKDSMPSNICNLNIAYFTDQKYLNKFWNVIKISNQFTYKFNIQGIFKNRYGGHRYDVGDWYTSHSDFHPIDEYSTVKLTLIVF